MSSFKRFTNYGVRNELSHFFYKFQGSGALMKEDSLIKKIDALRERIRLYDYHYYVLDEPLVPYIEYDCFFRELQDLESNHPQYISADSPTQRVGVSPVGTFEPSEHKQPMLSLGNVFSDARIRSFFQARCR